MTRIILSSYVATVVALMMGPSGLGANPAHEDGDKLEYIAANLAAAALLFDPLNLELVDELLLTPDDQGVESRIPSPTGSFITSDLFVSGHHAYLGSFGNAVHIVDISRPDQLRLVRRISTSGPAIDVKVEGGLAVVGVQESGSQFGLLIIDVSDPADPHVLAELSDPSWQGVHNLFLVGDRAYLAPIGGNERVRGVVIVDLADPTRPTISGNWVNEQPSFSNRIHDVFVDGGIAYISDFFSGLVLLDLADRDNPVTLATVPFDEGIHSAWAHNGYVYCNQEFGGPGRLLHVVDARDPSAPELVRSFHADVAAESGAIGPHNPYARDHWLYWAHCDAGVRVFDISLPENPVEVAYHPSSLAWGVQPHSDGHIYVADSRRGLLAIRFDQPAFALRSVSLTSPAVAGETARIEVSTQALPHRTDQLLVRVAASLNLAGSAIVVELQDNGLLDDLNGGDGMFSGSFAVPGNAQTGTYLLRAWTEDSGGAVYPLNGELEVRPALRTAVVEAAVEEDGVMGLPDQFELSQNFPNPFNSSTVIRFKLNEPGAVDLGIYNTSGQRLATLVDGVRPAGHYTVRWDGRGDDDRPLASGVYLYRLRAGGRHMLKKLLLVR